MDGPQKRGFPLHTAIFLLCPASSPTKGRFFSCPPRRKGCPVPCPSLDSFIALWNKSNGSYDIKEFGTLPLIFSTSKYFRWKFQPWPSFFPHANIPDTWKRGQLSLEQMKKMEKVKVKSHLRYLAACSIQKKRWDIWRIFFSDFRSVFSP